MLLNFLQRKSTLKKEKHVICPTCNGKSEIELWDKQTKAFLGDDIPSIKASPKTTTIPYQCPKCFTGHLSKSVKIV
ncbi:hypothetical protein H1D32_07900 [Anaerobacillus sp. CMMVII]|uniref:hypothetical protein n=1 Tax=Anaerobacillus sp. CMMVII TaxID=2755588 RepID=UPI0021B7A1CF|nr:hypothetical protein [Anaerobacillus sp. CMMVII]MCT8137685.1 hypothetical protein [Anaerobacillus sp. CMMVII]